jgi:CheY-like chemotaxis protein
LPAGRYVVLQFADTGCGIAPENLARIFEPYFSTKTQGSGLGLATVYSVVTKHHGHVEVKSTVGTGTTFTVWLPAVAEATTPAPVEPPTAPAAARVLLMDDEPSIRALARTVLKRAGCDVTAVAEGAAAVNEYSAALAAGRPFQVVILDLTVPGGMGGAETMRRLQAMDPGVCAIVSSGYSSDPVMANYQEHGFRARVPKPYQASDLVQAVKRLLPDERA